MSEYLFCICRDCMDIAVGDDPALCWECEEAGCEPLPATHAPTSLSVFGCQRDFPLEEC